MNAHVSKRRLASFAAPLLLLSLSVIGGRAAAAGDSESLALRNGMIGYSMTGRHWAVIATKEQSECPNGINGGPREMFDALFPADGKKRTVKDTTLARVAEKWNPTASDDEYRFFKELKSTVSLGLNLDGKIGASDFTSPQGEKGIDNQMYRVLGCVAFYRPPDGHYYVQFNDRVRTIAYNRILINISNVDSLQNDSDVQVTIYHGRDVLRSDAAGKDLPGDTQTVEARWGQQFVQQFSGKIVDGVLTTEPKDIYLPETEGMNVVAVQLIRGARFQLKLTPDGAKGLIGGYTDIDTFYDALNKAWSTHHHTYGKVSAPTILRALRRFADGYPDPKTGRNTAISSALEVEFTQAFIRLPPKAIAAAPKGRSPVDVASPAGR